MKKAMICINNRDYEDCMTIGKVYEVEVVYGNGVQLYRFLDDNGEPLQTALTRFDTNTMSTTIYKGDFSDMSWKEYCEECNVPVESNEITIYFNGGSRIYS